MMRLIRDFRDILFTVGNICPTADAAISYLLPIFCVYYSMAVLVQLRNTALLRVALLPTMPFFTLRAVLALDFSCGKHEQAPAHELFVALMIIWTARTIIWALRPEPYQRDNVRKSGSTSISMALWNAWELLMNMRGIGWNWSQGIAVPRPSREIHSRPRFLLHSAIRFLFCGLAFDAIAETIRTFSPDFSTPTGGSIIDPSLPFIPRYLRCVQITYLTLLLSFFAMQWVYQLLAVICIALFYQHPSQWPPVFNDPWLSTSLCDFWGRRWHQLLRYPFVWVGGAPCAYLFGRAGGILGTFLFSGIFHDIMTRCTGVGSNIPAVVGFFGMQGIGVLLERAWLKASGHRVRGIYGWIWTFTWLVLWGVPFVNQSAMSGRFAADTMPGGLRPTMYLISLVFPAGTDRSVVLNCLCFGTSLTFVAYSLFVSLV